MNDPEFASSISPSQPWPPLTFRRLLIGDDGLRAGWSLLLFVLLAALFIYGGNRLVHHLPTHSNTTSAGPLELIPNTAILGPAIAFTSLALAALLMSLVERRPFSRYGLTLRRMPTDFALGIFWGIFALSMLVAVLFLTHTIAFDSIALHGIPALTYALEWASVFLLVGLFEEFFFRGYLQYTLARGVAGLTRALSPGNLHAHVIGFWIAASIFSVILFTAAHTGNHGETFEGIAAVALAGTVFAFSLYRTGSLWWAIGFHTAWDWGQSYLYGTPDSGVLARGHLLITHPIGRPMLSGGSAGPEGSLFVLPTFLLVALIIHLTLPRRSYPLTADQSSDPAPVSSSPSAPGHISPI